MKIEKLCLITAVEHEFKIVASLLTRSSFSDDNEIRICRGLFGERRISVLKSGMGARAFTRRLANHLSLHDYDAVVVVGFAGGLDPRLRVGDAVIYNLCHWENNNDLAHSIACDIKLTGLISDIMRKSKLKFINGAGVTVSRLVTEASEKVALGRRYDALAADMESYGVMATCAEAHVPAAVLRIISDDAEADLPDFNSAIESDGRINNWKMALTILRTPLSSMRFFRKITPAVSAFRKSLKALLNP
jgi:adenosylhomocysteine nucleosidase